MIVEIVFVISMVLYVVQSYLLSEKKDYDKSVFVSAEILSHKFREGMSIEASIDSLSRSNVKCTGVFSSILERMERGDNLYLASEYVAKQLGSCPSGYLCQVIGCAGKYNHNLSGIFTEFFKDMRSAYMIGEERKKELATQSFIVFLIGSVLVPASVVIMASMFSIEIAFFIIIFLLVQSYLAAVASVIVKGELSDLIFMMPLGLSVTIIIIKYGLGGGAL